MANENELKKEGDGGKPAETVSKADFDAKVAEVAKMKQDLEDMRMEVFTPDYLTFLDTKGKPAEKAPEKTIVEEDLSKLSPKELLAKAKEEAKKELQQDIEKAKIDAVSTVRKENNDLAVAAFRRTHDDFEQWRPVMYGLSLDPKNKDLGLQELYDKAKDHIKRLGEPTAEEKEKQRKMATEKPGGNNEEAFVKYSKMSPDAVAKETMTEMKEKFGSIPPAV